MSFSKYIKEVRKQSLISQTEFAKALCVSYSTFTLIDMPFKGGVIVEDTKKLVLPEVPEFGFIGFENEQ